LNLAYRTANPDAQTQDAKPEFILTNSGDSPIPLDRIEIRYWFHDNSSQPFSFHCDWARLGCGVISGDFNSAAGGEQYLSLHFSQLAGVLQSGDDTGEIKIRFNRADWSVFDQTNHYSFATQMDYIDWQKVTVYFDGQLVWGTEPDGQSVPTATIQSDVVTSTLLASTSPTAISSAAEEVPPTLTPTGIEDPGTALPTQPNNPRVSSAALLLIGLLAGLSLGLLTIRIVRRGP
jgi:hypothetical protein